MAQAPRFTDADEETIAMGDTMSRMQISAEPPFLLLQARDFLVEARRLKPGAARNELRETAKVLRELAKLEQASGGGSETGPADVRY
jgi:hypothetical protein